jgi:hypothetical protein
MSYTTDPNDPRLGHGVDEKPKSQNAVYLVLSEEERAKGFVRPLRRAYKHVGLKPTYPLRDLTAEELEKVAGTDWVKYEEYPQEHCDRIGSSAVGKYWSQKDLDNHGCGTVTTMGYELCATYARDPHFYGSTYCCGCSKHLPVEEFVWVEDGQRVGS